MDLGLKDKVALVTGGSRGIGRAIALGLAAEGCRVAICARGEEDLEKTLGEIRSFGAEAFGSVADVAQLQDVERFMAESVREFGGIDILVNNVGGSAGGSLLEASDDDWQRTFDLNLFHAVRMTRAAVPHMRKRGGGAVIIISSISGWKPAPRGAQYGAAKAAEIFLAGALAWELAGDNIRVNAICPGSIFFPGGGWERFKARNPEAFEAFRSREFPLGRLGRPEEIANVVVFLASERASWVNSAAIPVDGAQGRPTAF